MTRHEILKALGWDDDLIAALDGGGIALPEFPEIELDFEPEQISTTEVSLTLVNPILLTHQVVGE